VKSIQDELDEEGVSFIEPYIKNKKSLDFIKKSNPKALRVIENSTKKGN